MVVTNETVFESDLTQLTVATDGVAKFFRLRKWDALFDGSNTSSFHGVGAVAFPVNSWRIVGIELQNIAGVAQANSLISNQSFKNFELTFEWAAGSANANSGVFFRTTESPSSSVAIEFQLLNDGGYPAFDPRQKMGSANGVLAPKGVVSRAVGVFNQIRLIAVGTKVEHWVNGNRVLAYDTGSSEFRSATGNSLLTSPSNYGNAEEGFIMLQYHNGLSRFRNIRVRSLD